MFKLFVSIPICGIPHGTTLTKLKKILDILDDDQIAGHAQEMQDRIADCLRITGARLKIDSTKQVRWELKLIF